MLLVVFCDAQENEPRVSPKRIFVGVICWVSLGVFAVSCSIWFTSPANKVRFDFSKVLLFRNSEIKDISKLRVSVIYKRVIIATDQYLHICI